MIQTPSHRLHICFGLLMTALLLIAGCGKSDQTQPATTARPSTAAPKAPNSLEITFVYGSEKKSWINDVTDQFNREKHQTDSGKVIVIKSVPLGSGETIDEVISGRMQAHLVSPASGAFIKLGNAESRVKTGQDLIGPTKELVNSPVVIAMWKPMAEALGWPGKSIGWSDIISLSKNEQGWSGYGHPEWGKFKFGHTHPDYSNSGLISVLAEVYAGTGRNRNLTIDDVNKPQVAKFVQDVERSVVHYGSSTGFFGDKMFQNGPGYLSAAVLYESVVIESYGLNPKPPLDVVAIYPREGTFWSDHPVGIVNRDWVTPDHRDAAQKYIDYLLAGPQQKKALQYGFRPGNTSITADAPIDTAHGVDPTEPKTTLEVPPADIMNAALDIWRKNKKHANIVLVFDRSGSMSQEGRMANAQQGALQFVDLLSDEDELSLLVFSNQVTWSGKNLPMKTARAQAKQNIQGWFPDGNTHLYDAIDTAYAELLKNASPDRISAIVVLTDGADTGSSMKFQELLSKISADEEKSSVRIFTIGYATGDNKTVLKKMADESKAKFYEGNPGNIREVFKDIATFF